MELAKHHNRKQNTVMSQLRPETDHRLPASAENTLAGSVKCYMKPVELAAENVHV
jgi:hypothetical protein